MKWIRVNDIAERMSVGLMYARQLLKAEDAPKPIRLSSRVMVYNEDEVIEWMKRLQEAHRGDPSAKA